MTRMRKAMAAAVVVLAAMSASAQEVDAETRFHRAYEREVVDGKVADAAREYLAMMGDEKFPERLRLEAKFRFAVTAMLLGRADEARVHLGALAADAKAPETLRARATEYLDAAKGVGVGNEIDRKMQSLVFDLAKAPPSTEEPVGYRDFQVIGKRAVPFLRQLLQHEDVAIRTHAFRILLRMDEPELADVWTPAVTGDWRAAVSFTGYLKLRPAACATFERRLLALDDQALQTTLAGQQSLRPAYSAESLRAFASRKVPPGVLLACFPSNWTEETDRVRGEWIAGDDAKLSEEATLSYLAFMEGVPPKNVALRTDLFPAIVARLETMPIASIAPYTTTGTKIAVPKVVTDGLAYLASTLPAEQLLDTLATVIERGAAEPPGGANPLRSGLVHALASAVERRDPRAELPARYGEIVKRWGAEASKQGFVPMPDFALHVSVAAYRMPVEPATALATWAVTTTLTGVKTSEVAKYLPRSRARDVPALMAAIRSGDAQLRATLMASFRPTTDPVQPELADAYLRVLPELVRLWSRDFPGQYLDPVVAGFVVFAKALPADAAREHLAAAAIAVAENSHHGTRQQAFSIHLFGLSVAGQSAYWVEIAIPTLDRVWRKLDESDRALLFSYVLALLDIAPRDDALRAEIGRFTKARYGEVPRSAGRFLANAPDVFPLTEWVPRVLVDNSASVSNERADPAVREMTTDVASVNENVLAFTARLASPDVQRDVFDRMLRTGPIARMDVVSLNSRLASADAIEEGIGRMVAEKAPDTNALGRLVVRLRTVRPSEALFPAVRVLLRSDEVTTGVETAKLLGREELLPDLAGLLDSMDSTVRTAAKEAIDSIVALRKLKEEARRGAGK